MSADTEQDYKTGPTGKPVCPNCGIEMDEKESFYECSKCGYQL